MSSIIKTERVRLESGMVSYAGSPSRALDARLYGAGRGDPFEADHSSGPTADSGAEDQARRDAEMESQSIIQDAITEAERIRQAARQEGFSQGWEEGMAKGQVEARAQADILRRLADELLQAKGQVAADCEQELVSLALAIAHKIVRSQALVDRELVTRVVRAATQSMNSQDVVRIAINPADLEAVSAYWTSDHDPNYRDHGLELAADERVDRGGCIITTKRGTIDAQLDVQISEIERAFRAAAESG